MSKLNFLKHFPCFFWDSCWTIQPLLLIQSSIPGITHSCYLVQKVKDAPIEKRSGRKKAHFLYGETI
ncbi:hypothetical protein Y032_0360g3439 [Ancylostoma ceylanicum]|uniref:Uncharacterized protein n=1 Tax=Ancylostoma ceylanicum TaxID=53326 RepID=A0A016RVP7_9BILA|nr:hypothetical protein Y032_0360g3439 [Ancylostoma ceylanicum]